MFLFPKKYKAELGKGQDGLKGPVKRVAAQTVGWNGERSAGELTGIGGWTQGSKGGEDATPVCRSGSWAEGETCSRKDRFGKQWEGFTSGCFEVG